jgi:hypothetical protein
MVWTIGRIFYALGYKNSVNGRKFGGMLSHLGDIPLIFSTLWIAGKMTKIV